MSCFKMLYTVETCESGSVEELGCGLCERGEESGHHNSCNTDYRVEDSIL